MNTSSKTARGRSTGAKSQTAVKSQIDENLKRVYEHALNEEVPDRFKILLEKLKRGGPVPSDTAPRVPASAPAQGPDHRGDPARPPAPPDDPDAPAEDPAEDEDFATDADPGEAGKPRSARAEDRTWAAGPSHGGPDHGDGPTPPPGHAAPGHAEADPTPRGIPPGQQGRPNARQPSPAVGARSETAE